MPWADKDALTPQNLNSKGALVLNVKDPQFGALGDNSTDDTAAIQAAITAANDTSGVVGWSPVKAVVYLPPGRYIINAPLEVAGVSLWGAGPTDFYGSVLQIGADFVGTHAVILTGAAGNRVGSYRDFMIYGELDTGAVGGLKLSGLLTHNTFQNLNVAAVKADAYTLTGADVNNQPIMNTFINIRCGNNSNGHGLTMDAGLQNTFYGCAFQGLDKNGVNITSSVVQASRNTFINLWVEGVNRVTNQAAVYIKDCSNTTFITPTITTYGLAGGSASHGFELDTAHHVLIDGPAIGAVTAGSSFKLDVTNSRVLRLMRLPSNFTTADANGMAGLVNKDIIDWNDSGDTRSGGVFLDVRVTTLADDATPTVQAGNLFKTGGTTTITDFDAGLVGQTIKILAAHSVTITDGAPIILAGGANFDMVATDTLTLTMFDDQVWQEVSRSVN